MFLKRTKVLLLRCEFWEKKGSLVNLGKCRILQHVSFGVGVKKITEPVCSPFLKATKRINIQLKFD